MLPVASTVLLRRLQTTSDSDAEDSDAQHGDHQRFRDRPITPADVDGDVADAGPASVGRSKHHPNAGHVGQIRVGGFGKESHPRVPGILVDSWTYELTEHDLPTPVVRHHRVGVVVHRECARRHDLRIPAPVVSGISGLSVRRIVTDLGKEISCAVVCRVRVGESSVVGEAEDRIDGGRDGHIGVRNPTATEGGVG